MNGVFFGSSKFVIPIIEVLRKNFGLCLVITTEKLPTDPLISYCIKSKVCYYVVTDFRDKKLINDLTNIKASIGILASFGAIIPKEILKIFPYGIINIHPSLLPKYRGPSPVQAAILNGDRITGVTIIKLDNQVDHGPILIQKECPIFERDTSESLYERLFRLGTSTIVQTIKLFIKGKITPYKQDHKKATFTSHLTRKHGFIDFNNPLSPEKLQRMIRAYYPWPGAWFKTELNGKYRIIKLLPNNLISQYPNDLFLIQVEGKKPMSYKDFINGYPEAARNLECKIKNS